jgi:hypothetical protein
MPEDAAKRPFISYAREDRATAARLAADLRAAGAEPWLDSEQLLGGQAWEPAIRRAIRDCTHFIALLSESSVNKRGFVQKEVRAALEILDELPPDQVFLIPVRLDESIPSHDRLSQLHWIDLFPAYSEGLARITASLGLLAKSGATRPPAGDARLHLSAPDVPADVVAVIRARGEKDYPDDFSTRKYVIDNELQAWRSLREFVVADVPADVLALISREAERRYPDQFSTRLYVVNNEVSAWRDLQRIEVPEMPPETFNRIVNAATRRYPSDFSTRLYVIRNEISAWRELYG